MKSGINIGIIAYIKMRDELVWKLPSAFVASVREIKAISKQGSYEGGMKTTVGNCKSTSANWNVHNYSARKEAKIVVINGISLAAARLSEVVNSSR